MISWLRNPPRARRSAMLGSVLSPMLSLGLLLGAACVPTLISEAHAQTWPSKPIKLIVPMPAAGTTDNRGRLAGQKLAELFG